MAAPYRCAMLGPMGFNPERSYRRRPSDYLLVAAAIAICIAALVWALLG